MKKVTKIIQVLCIFVFIVKGAIAGGDSYYSLFFTDQPSSDSMEMLSSISELISSNEATTTMEPITTSTMEPTTTNTTTSIMEPTTTKSSVTASITFMTPMTSSMTMSKSPKLMTKKTTRKPPAKPRKKPSNQKKNKSHEFEDSEELEDHHHFFQFPAPRAMITKNDDQMSENVQQSQNIPIVNDPPLLRFDLG